MARKFPQPPKSKKSPLPPKQKKAPVMHPSARPDGMMGQTLGADLSTLDSAGVAPRTRLRDAKAMHSLFLTLLHADKKSAYNRAVLNEMVDGAPPQPDSTLKQLGLGWVYNLNWLGAETRLAAALVSYDDLADSSEHLIVPDVKPNFLEADDLIEASDIVSEEHGKLIREESPFYSRWQILAKEFAGHGVGFAYYPDADTPWWKSGGWDQVLLPRKTPVEPDAIPVFFTRHPYRADELYKFIDDSKYSAGWNKEEVQKAIVNAANGRNKSRQWDDQWREIEVQLKNNDIGYGIGDSEEILCIQGWVREFDGSYSFYIGLESGNNTDFLYKDESRYENVNQAVVTFELGVGNGTYHSIRGMLWKMHPFIQAQNRFENNMLTNADVAMRTFLQGEDGESYDDLQITLQPGFGYLPAGAKVIERKFPDVGTQGMPVVERLDRKVQEATGQFQAPIVSSPSVSQGNPETKYAIQSRQQSEGSLTSNSVNRFYRSLDTLLNEQFRRIQKLGPAGKDAKVKEFYARCKERLAPLGIDAANFIQNGIRRVTAARAIGDGSPQARMLKLDRLNQMAGALDETGRELAARDLISQEFGRTTADRYKPRVKRIAPDAQIAQVENAALKADSVEVSIDQNHRVHASIHVPKFQEVLKTIVSYREQDPEADFAPMRPNLEYAYRLHDHSSQHVQGMAANPMFAADMKSYRAALEQGGNLLAGFARELQAQERHAINQQQGQQQQPQQPGQPAASGGQPSAQDQQDAISAGNPKETFRIAQQQQQLQHAQELHQLAMQLASTKVAAVAQQMQLDKIKTDASVSAQIAQNRSRAPQ